MWGGSERFPRLGGRRFVVVGCALVLIAAYAGFAVLSGQKTRAAHEREAKAVAVLRALQGRVEEQVFDEIIPFGRLLPGTGAASVRFIITLRNAHVTDEDLAVLDRFDADRLASLDLLNCRVGDATLERAGRFRKLLLLGVGQARNSQQEPWPTTPTGLLTNAGFAHLDQLTELQTAGLHGPDVTDHALAHLAGASKLRVLILYGSRVTGAGLAALGSKPELATLKLGGTRFGDADVPALARFPALEYLDLRDTAVTDAALPRIAALPRLKRLSLAGCSVTPAAVERLLQTRRGLAVEGPGGPREEKPSSR